MHIVLLTMMALTGADANQVTSVSPSDAYYTTPAMGPGECDGCAGGVDSCGCGRAADRAAARAAKQAERAAKRAAHAAELQRRHMMPQTCYQPRYGCYYSGDRHMHRYPAFHGTFYRRPYNYRNLFEYPWHAEMHEPTSMFSYNVEGTDAPAMLTEQPIEGPPIPPAARVFVGD